MKGSIKNNIYHKYEKESSRFRKIGGKEGSWTINLNWIKNKEISKIIYETTKAIYSIDFCKAYKVGVIRTFQGEIKLIVPIYHWEVIKK